MHIRQEWVQKSEFHPSESHEVLNEVIKRSRAILAQGKLPIVVFDLDSTLFNVSMRSYEILREWLSHPGANSFQETVARLHELNPNEMKYSLQEVWDGRKIPHETVPYNDHFHHVKSFWRKRFFSNEYLVYDRPTEGAVRFVKTLHDLGAKIVYLTGRDVPLMSFGTYDQLKAHQLPIEVDRTRLILKPKRHHDDLEFKGQAATTIMGWGEVVASFENEPKNLVAMAKVFKPETMNVFIDSVSSDHPAPSAKGLYKITSFEFDESALGKNG
jgi:hypothetical protein